MQSYFPPRWIRVLVALSSWPLEWARGMVQRHAVVRRSVVALASQPTAPNTARWAEAAWLWQASAATVAFDLARNQYAAGVQAGLIERSLLASAAFERRLGLLERLTLGPLARSV